MSGKEEKKEDQKKQGWVWREECALVNRLLGFLKFCFANRNSYSKLFPVGN